MAAMLKIPRVFPRVSCRGSAKAVQCPCPGPKIGDKSQQIPRYSPVCPRGHPPGMAADKCISELFSLLTCFPTTTFTLLSIFSPLEMISTKIWETPLSWHVKCSLPVAVRVSKTRVLKLPIVRGQICEHIFAPNEGYCLYIQMSFTQLENHSQLLCGQDFPNERLLPCQFDV